MRISKRSQPYDELRIKAGDKEYVFRYKDLVKGAETFRAIMHRIRQDILKMLSQKRRMSVSEILNELRAIYGIDRGPVILEQSVISQHLAILRRAGFVRSEKVRRNNYYVLNPAKLQEVEEYLSRIIWGGEGDDAEEKERSSKRQAGSDMGREYV